MKDIRCLFNSHNWQRVPGWKSRQVVVVNAPWVDKDFTYLRRLSSALRFNEKYVRPAYCYVCLRCGECLDEEQVGLRRIEEQEARERQKRAEDHRRALMAKDLWNDNCGDNPKEAR
jgi:hypothetical protein